MILPLTLEARAYLNAFGTAFPFGNATIDLVIKYQILLLSPLGGFHCPQLPAMKLFSLITVQGVSLCASLSTYTLS